MLDEKELKARLLEILFPESGKLECFEEKITALCEEASSKSMVYERVLFMLSNIRFEGEDALKYWDEITAHRQALTDKLEREVSFRVALLDYFTSAVKLFKNPLMVELNLFESCQYNNVIDELTGIYNQRFLREYLWKESRRAIRYDRPFSIIMTDVDDFHLINDFHTNLAGDEVLKSLAGVYETHIRVEDIIVRFVADRFVILLTNSGREGAIRFGERILPMVLAQSLTFNDIEIKYSVSGGIAVFMEDTKDPVELLEMAEKALYRAKADGKSRIYPYQA